MTTHSDLIRGLEALKKSVPYPDPQDQMYGNCRLANREAEIHNAALDLAAEIVRNAK